MNDRSLAVRDDGYAELAPTNLFHTDDPTAIVAKASAMATALADVIRAKKLTSNINGREYVRVEGWTLLGSMMGVFPVLVWTRPVEGGWEARVEARTLAGAVVGASEAQCLSTERNWANRDDFALRSMAQTRATAKALRLPLGFIVEMAGYNATPAEEMPVDAPAQSSPARRQGRPTPPAPGTLGPALEAAGATMDDVGLYLRDAGIHFSGEIPSVQMVIAWIKQQGMTDAQFADEVKAFVQPTE